MSNGTENDEVSNKERLRDLEVALGTYRLPVNEKNIVDPNKLTGDRHRVQVNTDEPAMMGFIIGYLNLYYPDLLETTRRKRRAEIVNDYVEVLRALAQAGHAVQIRGHLKDAVPDRELRAKITKDLERFEVPIQ